METRYIAALVLGSLVIIVLIIFLTKKKSKSSDPSPSSGSVLWSGNCSGEFKSSCDNNNNCVILCDNNVLKISQDQCGGTQDECNGDNCTSTCVSPPRPILTCDGGSGIWQGKCTNIPSISTNNYAVTVTCDGVNITPKTECDNAQVMCEQDNCVVCCTPHVPPPAPSCPSGSSQVWSGENCSFIQSECDNNTCTVSCGGSPVYSGNCASIETSCNNDSCVACCVASASVPMPTCSGTVVWSTNNPQACSNINSSCQNGTCTVMCSGNVVYTDSSGYNSISSVCNTAGCVVCAN